VTRVSLDEDGDFRLDEGDWRLLFAAVCMKAEVELWYVATRLTAIGERNPEIHFILFSILYSKSDLSRIYLTPSLLNKLSCRRLWPSG
jgi:hypothetical protein